MLLAHTSTLALLAAEQDAGRLHICPRAITAISELLTDADRRAIHGAFGVPPVSGFVSTEGLAGHIQPGGTVLRVASDRGIDATVVADGWLAALAVGDGGRFGAARRA